MSQVNPVPAKKGGCMGNLFKIVGAVVVGFIVLVIIVSIVNPSRSTKTTGTAVSVAPGKVAVSEPQSVTVVADPPTATPEWMAPPYDEVCGSNSELTEVQQEAKVKKMIKKKVVGWTGIVYDVARNGDKYKVSVNMQQGFIRTKDVVISGMSEDDAVALNVDQEISYDGTIDDISISFGVICNPLTITDAVITAK
ncbi:MAG TPA: hypothetical protein VNJ01_03630 [Bacteriovoracaceae bacterium]|nr:hypothetical protein [Bacteriovoracaceae bacterium]